MLLNYMYIGQATVMLHSLRASVTSSVLQVRRMYQEIDTESQRYAAETW